MKKVLIYTAALLVFMAQACQKYDNPVPNLEKFGIYELVDDGTGNMVPGSELSTIPANTTVRIQVFSDADICILWTGDYSYRPWGENDSVLDSHSYEHYGQVGAQGYSTGAIEGDVLGWFRDYSWDAGSYTVTVILTSHAIASSDYEQRIFDFPITVQ